MLVATVSKVLIGSGELRGALDIGPATGDSRTLFSDLSLVGAGVLPLGVALLSPGFCGGTLTVGLAGAGLAGDG